MLGAFICLYQRHIIQLYYMSLFIGMNLTLVNKLNRPNEKLKTLSTTVRQNQESIKFIYKLISGNSHHSKTVHDDFELRKTASSEMIRKHVPQHSRCKFKWFFFSYCMDLISYLILSYFKLFSLNIVIHERIFRIWFELNFVNKLVMIYAEFWRLLITSSILRT